MNRVFAAVFPPGNAIEKGHPVVDAGLLQLVALLKNISGTIPFVDTVKRPVIAAFHAQGNFPHTEFLHLFKFFDSLVSDIGHAGRSVNILDFRQILVDYNKDRLEPFIRKRQRICRKKLNRPGFRIVLGKFFHVFLDPFHRGHLKRHILVHRTKLTLVMGAALCDL